MLERIEPTKKNICIYITIIALLDIAIILLSLNEYHFDIKKYGKEIIGDIAVIFIGSSVLGIQIYTIIFHNNDHQIIDANLDDCADANFAKYDDDV